MSIFKKIYVFMYVFIKEMWNEMGKPDEILSEKFIVEIEIHIRRYTL